MGAYYIFSDRRDICIVCKCQQEKKHKVTIWRRCAIVQLVRLEEEKKNISETKKYLNVPILRDAS